MSNPSVGLRDAYKLYRKMYKDTVLLSIYLKVVLGYTKFMTSRLLLGEVVPLAERLGDLEISGIKLKPRLDDEGRIQGLSPNWKATLDLWEKCESCKENKELIYYFDEHTQGIRYKLRWSKKKVFVDNKEFYSFRLSFGNKKKVSRSLHEGAEYHVRN